MLGKQLTALGTGRIIIRIMTGSLLVTMTALC